MMASSHDYLDLDDEDLYSADVDDPDLGHNYPIYDSLGQEHLSSVHTGNAMEEHFVSQKPQRNEIELPLDFPCLLLPGALNSQGVPSNWNAYLTGEDTQDYVLQELSADGFEYQVIEGEMKTAGLSVTKVERVQSHRLLDTYKHQMTHLFNHRRPGFELKERYLYHGSTAPKDQICEEGLDMRLSRIGRFGRGIYFSDNPLKCVNYANKDTSSDEVFVLKCRVLLGDTKVYQPGESDTRLKREPLKDDPRGSWKYYDSVKGRPKDYNEFVVYQNSRVLVEYIVYFGETNSLDQPPPENSINEDQPNQGQRSRSNSVSSLTSKEGRRSRAHSISSVNSLGDENASTNSRDIFLDCNDSERCPSLEDNHESSARQNDTPRHVDDEEYCPSLESNPGLDHRDGNGYNNPFLQNDDQDLMTADSHNQNQPEYWHPVRSYQGDVADGGFNEANDPILQNLDEESATGGEDEGAQGQEYSRADAEHICQMIEMKAALQENVSLEVRQNLEKSFLKTYGDAMAQTGKKPVSSTEEFYYYNQVLNSLVGDFMSVTNNLDQAVAKRYLEKNSMDLDLAIFKYYEEMD